jgi:Leucine Rich repeat
VRACANVTELVITNSRCIRDDVGLQVGSLRLLKKVDLSGCTALSDASFSALGPLAETLEDVTLTRTRISNSCALSLLPRLQRLRRLSVHRCWPLGAAIVSQLPATLTHLDVGGTQVLDVSIRPSLLQTVPLLDSLHVSGAWQLTDVSELWSVRLQLKELAMSGCRRLSDGALRAGIAGMDELERLELSHTCAGDETARGIACLPKLSYLDVSDTCVQDDGVLLLAAGKVCHSLTTVVVSGSRTNDAIDVLRAALGGQTALILRGVRYSMWP